MIIRPLLLSLWWYLDPLYFRLSRLEYPGTGPGIGSVFRVRLTRYKGSDVQLSDGTVIHKNDLLLKIHLHNVKILKRCPSNRHDLARGWDVFRQVKRSMPHLADYIRSHHKGRDIKGIVGITLLSKGFAPLGFECIAPASRMYACYKKISHLPIYFLSSTTFSLRSFLSQRSVYLIMSSEKLLDQYENKTARQSCRCCCIDNALPFHTKRETKGGRYE